MLDWRGYIVGIAHNQVGCSAHKPWCFQVLLHAPSYELRGYEGTSFSPVTKLTSNKTGGQSRGTKLPSSLLHVCPYVCAGVWGAHLGPEDDLGLLPGTVHLVSQLGSLTVLEHAGWFGLASWRSLDLPDFTAPM